MALQPGSVSDLVGNPEDRFSPDGAHIHVVLTFSRFKCHKDCVNRAPPSCGLPDELVDAVLKSVFEGEFFESKEGSPQERTAKGKGLDREGWG